VLFKILKQTHPERNAELITKIRKLYQGGYELRAAAKDILPKAPGEPQSFYEHRIKYASYVPYFGQLVDYLVGCVFQQSVQVTPAADADNPDTPGKLPAPDFYRLFARDTDRKGTTFAQTLRCVLTEALLCRRAWVAADMPPAVIADTLAEEEEAGGSRGYCYQLEYEQVLDWKDGDDGDLDWVILCKRIIERDSPLDDRETYRLRFTIWEEVVQGPGQTRAKYTIFETGEIKVGDEPKDTEDIPQTGGGLTTFSTVPIKRLDLPDGLWAGNKLAPLAEEHFRRRSDLVGSMTRSLFEIPYVKQGPEIPDMGGAISAAAENPNRGDDPVGQFKSKGYIVLGPQDEIGFAGPSGKAFEVAERQLGDLRDEIYRAVNAMSLSLANTGAAVGRSGDSKREDRSSLEVVLTYLGELTRDFAVKLYSTISEGRGEEVVWVAHGLDSFDVDDRQELIDEAVALQLADVPSKTFKTEYKTKLALGVLPGMSPETKAQIQSEIAESVQSEPDEPAAQLEIRSALAQLGKGGGAPGPASAAQGGPVRAPGPGGRPSNGKNDARGKPAP
jgi:hypothetical protein